ncbi:MAG TPA: PLP-dependent aminotransferase family protein [Candidatus Limnocylindrales bacterium]|nr:PLP-dependent aminotransferase family protein [Candidatus Limnocylindrales bacterium]
MPPTLPIELDRTSPEPLYRQVAAALRDAIDAGRLRAGQQVPSVRALAGQLGIGRLTVSNAYEQLAADGYLVGRVGFGTIVAPERRPSDGRPRALRSLGGGRAFPVRPAAAGDALRPRFDLRSSAAAGWSGVGDGGLAVGATLERLLRDEFRRVAERRDGGEIADPAGDARLRAAIAAHLRATRAARCEPDQIVILSGAVIGFGVIGRLFLAEGGRVAVEDPGDPGVRRAILASGGSAVGVPVDRQGLLADRLPADARVAVVAPTVSVASGASMPLARRLRVLAWATTHDVLVVEDGRLDDLVLRVGPGPCLQGIDDDGRVIHVGSFETLLHSGIRTAYAVLPPALVGPFVDELGAFDPGASPVQQRALGRFLADGLLDRHLARVRRELLDRQNAALAAIETELGWLLDAREAAGGTRLIATVEDPRWTASAIVERAADDGIAIAALGPERLTPAPDRAIVVDYGRLTPLELRAAFRALGRSLRAGTPARSRPPVRLSSAVATPA